MENGNEQEKQIVINPGKPPLITGAWSVGDAVRNLEAAIMWIQSLAVPETRPQPVDADKE